MFLVLCDTDGDVAQVSKLITAKWLTDKCRYNRGHGEFFGTPLWPSIWCAEVMGEEFVTLVMNRFDSYCFARLTLSPSSHILYIYYEPQGDACRLDNLRRKWFIAFLHALVPHQVDRLRDRRKNALLPTRHSRKSASKMKRGIDGWPGNWICTLMMWWLHCILTGCFPREISVTRCSVRTLMGTKTRDGTKTVLFVRPLFADRDRVQVEALWVENHITASAPAIANETQMSWTKCARE